MNNSSMKTRALMQLSVETECGKIKKNLLHFYIKPNDDSESSTLGGAAIIYLKQTDVFSAIRFPSEITSLTVTNTFY